MEKGETGKTGKGEKENKEEEIETKSYTTIVYIPEILIRNLDRSQGVDIYSREEMPIGLGIEVLVVVGPLENDFEMIGNEVAVL